MSESDLVVRLRAAGSVFAEEEAAVLISSAVSADHLEAMTVRRVAGEPLEVILGWAEFCGERISLVAGVFVPRARTAVLVDEGARLIGPGAVVVDLCCGSGAVAVALHARVPGILLLAADIDPVAVDCARRNLDPVGGQVFEGDLFSALPDDVRGRIDLLVVNAPYVPTEAIATMPPEARDHEPRIALDGGADGVDVHRRVAGAAGQWLAPGGHVVIETSRRQASATARAFSDHGLDPRIVSSQDVDGTAVVGVVHRA